MTPGARNGTARWRCSLTAKRWPSPMRTVTPSWTTAFSSWSMLRPKAWSSRCRRRRPSVPGNKCWRRRISTIPLPRQRLARRLSSVGDRCASSATAPRSRCTCEDQYSAVRRRAPASNRRGVAICARQNYIFNEASCKFDTSLRLSFPIPQASTDKRRSISLPAGFIFRYLPYNLKNS